MYTVIPFNTQNLQNLQKGGTLIYIDNNNRYKVRNDLKIYKSKEIESTFIEIIEAK